jgi:hypothetical protein
MLSFGVFNLGYLHLAGASGLACAAWWGERLSFAMSESDPTKPFTDQEWMDLVPIFFPQSQINRNPGMNIAPWNLDERVLSFSEAGDLLVNGQKVVFIHFSKEGRALIDQFRRSGGFSLVMQGVLWNYESKLQQVRLNLEDEAALTWSLNRSP